MKTRAFVLFGALALTAVAAQSASAHCQIPCGIYNDPVRFTLMEEHVATIEKSVAQILALSKEPQPNYSQIVRWVNNKDSHADQLTEIVTYYFMAQRVKSADPADKVATAKYLREITTLHEIVIGAMKAKQTTDLENCARLRELIARFKASYLGEPAQPSASAKPSTSAEHTHPHP